MLLLVLPHCLRVLLVLVLVLKQRQGRALQSLRVLVAMLLVLMLVQRQSLQKVFVLVAMLLCG